MIRKIYIAIIAAAMLFTVQGSAEMLKIEKLTDMYALRENSELVQYRETDDNNVKRIAVNVVDFNNSAYITSDGGIFKISGEKIAGNAKKMPGEAPFRSEKYNGEYAFISRDDKLVFPKDGAFDEVAVSSDIKEVRGNLILKNTGELFAVTEENGMLSEVKLADDINGIYGDDGEYLALDSLGNCYFIPLKKGKFIYDYDKLMIETNVRSCPNIHGVVTKDNKWYSYNLSGLKSGKVIKTLKSSSAGTTGGGDYLFLLSNSSAGCNYKGTDYFLFGNVREIRQIKVGSMDGYIMDNADTVHRLTAEDNVLTSEEIISPSPLFSIRAVGKGYCIAMTDGGELYGIDKAVTFGTGKISENTTAECVALPISRKNIDIYLNGEKIHLSRRITEKGNRTLYPMRELSEILGAEVKWDEETKTASAVLGDNSVEFTVNRASYLKNGEKRVMDAVPVLDELTESVYVPLRYMAEALGYNVEWRSEPFDDIIDIMIK